MQPSGFAQWAQQARQEQSFVGCFAQPANPPMAVVPRVVQVTQMVPMTQLVPVSHMVPMTRLVATAQLVPSPLTAPIQSRPVAAPPLPLRSIPGNLNYDRLPVGPALSSGQSKTVLPLLVPETGQLSGHVLVVERNPYGWATPHEISHLADLQDIGVPVTPIQSFGMFRGHAARLMPQMVKIDLATNGLLTSPFVTRATLESLQVILSRLETHGIPLDDVELLMHPADGSLYVSAPAGNVVDMAAGELPPKDKPRRGVIASLKHAADVLRQRFPDRRN